MKWKWRDAFDSASRDPGGVTLKPYLMQAPVLASNNSNQKVASLKTGSVHHDLGFFELASGAVSLRASLTNEQSILTKINITAGKTTVTVATTDHMTMLKFVSIEHVVKPVLSSKEKLDH